MRIRLALVVAILAGIATTTPARAESVYAYWSYWQGDAGNWKYAVTGPATSAAIDGAVDGWRFTLGSDGKAARPSLAADFQAICGSIEKTSGKARIAIIIDYGTAADVPAVAICSVIPAGLSRASALGAVATLRLNNGFICGINAMPETGCGDAVAAPSGGASPSPMSTPESSPSANTSKRPMAAQTEAAPTAGDSPSALSEASTPPATASATAAGPQPTETPAARATTPSDAEPTPNSPIATIVSMVLAGIVLALALRNAKRQRESS